MAARNQRTGECMGVPLVLTESGSFRRGERNREIPEEVTFDIFSHYRKYASEDWGEMERVNAATGPGWKIGCKRTGSFLVGKEGERFTPFGSGGLRVQGQP